jgi:protein O-GlcNAc transferase
MTLRPAGQEFSTYIEWARGQISDGRLEAAIDSLLRGLSVSEPNEQLYRIAVFALAEANRTAEALQLAAHARKLFPGARDFHFSEALTLPVLYETEQEIDSHRARFSAGLERLAAGLKLDTPEDRRLALDAAGRYLNFYLGYQGRNDRALQEQYGQLLHRIVAASYPEWTKPLDMPPFRGRIRIGYISAHFRNHSVAKLFSAWLYERDRRDFEAFVYHNGQTLDAVTERVRNASDHFYHMPGDFEPLCRAVLSDRLHVAVFLDVRHRRMALASALRLAPVQCLAWAHPMTSGSPMMDYFLSSDYMEPEDGQEHYSERLIRLPGIGVYYPKPVIPRPLLGKTRADFGLGEDRTVLLCCQSTFKYLPQHDDVFVRIAQRLPASQFAFLGLNDAIAKAFLSRLERAFGAEGLKASDYCVILPKLNAMDYWNLNIVSDIFLDSLEWSGGVTALEAIACGLPIVTLPGRFMRGRHSYGILTQLGVTETIAHDKKEYVEIVVRLSSDREWRAQILERMAAGHERLYWDTRSVRALEDFFRGVCGKAAA